MQSNWVQGALAPTANCTLGTNWELSNAQKSGTKPGGLDAAGMDEQL